MQIYFGTVQTENKVAKNIGLLYWAKLFLGKDLLLTPYFLHIHTYLDYANLLWDSTNRTNLKQLLSQKRTQYKLSRIEHALTIPTTFFKSQKILNISNLNILSVTVFMYQIRNKTVSLKHSQEVLRKSVMGITNFSQFNYKISKTKLSKSKFKISFRRPSIWNNFLQNFEKEADSILLFKSKLTLLSFSNEITYF